jgi:predicted transcriptional regulator
MLSWQQDAGPWCDDHQGTCSAIYDTLHRAVALLLKNHIGAAPVVNKAGVVVGMLSAIDLLRALADTIEQQKKKKWKMTR